MSGPAPKLTKAAPAEVLGYARPDTATVWPAPLDLATLAEHEPEPPRFIVPGGLPVGYATLLAGHGGVGKSAIALHLAVAIAFGARWAGIDCAPRKVLYLACEDREGVLHWRLARIARYIGISIVELVDRLDIVELVGHDCMLWERDPRTGYTITPAFGQLSERVRASGSEVLIVDGVADTFGGNENSRGEVKRYVNALLSLLPAETGALLLVAHIDKALARGTGATSDGYSGSTSWHNSVRARWYLYPETLPADGDGPPERTGTLRLELQKSNLGPVDQSIRWRWDAEEHMFLPEPVATQFDREHQAREDRRGILLALKGCSAIGIIVPAAMTGPRTAYHVLAARPEFPITMRSTRSGARRFWREIEQLRQLKLVEEVAYRRKNRHEADQLMLTQEGMRQCA
jgi:RecA-family ATPase